MRILFVILLLIGSVAESLKMFRVEVPPLAYYGESITLKCQFRLEKNHRLYSVRWYKDNEEFFRYVPRFKPQIRAHNVEGVNVDTTRSTNQTVTLNPVEMRSTGVYRCEVSLEAPSFTSDQGEGRMTVVYLPTEAPQITGNIKEVYEVGEMLDLNCISSKSSPPAKISWYINDSPVTTERWVFADDDPENRYLDSLNITAVEDNLYASQLRLRLQLKPTHFRSNGVAKVRCRSRISTHDWDEHGNGGHIMRSGRRGENELGYESSYQQVYDHSLSNNNNHRHPVIYDEKETSFLVRSSSTIVFISLQLIPTTVTLVLAYSRLLSSPSSLLSLSLS